MHEWDTFAVIIGGSAGALVGLLFVALSIHAGRVAESADLRNRAAQTLVIFAVVLLIGVLLAIPLQSEWLLGAVLLALGVLAAGLVVVLDHRAGQSDSHKSLAQTLKVVNPSTLTAGGTALAGVLILSRISWAKFLLVPTVCGAMILGLTGAYLLLTKLTDSRNVAGIASADLVAQQHLQRTRFGGAREHIISRVELVEPEPVRDHGRGVQMTAGHQAGQRRRRIGVNEPGSDGQVLDPDVFQVQCHRRAVHADVGDMASWTDQRYRQFERLRNSDGLHRHIGTEPAGDVVDHRRGVFAFVVDHNVGTELARRIEPGIDPIDRHNVAGGEQLRGEDSRQPDGSGTDDRDDICRTHRSVEHADLVGGWQDIGQHQHLLVADAVGNLVRRTVGERYPDVFGLRAVDQVAEDPATAAQALAVCGLPAIPAATAGRDARDKHPVTDCHPLQGGPDLDDGADGFVSEHAPRRDLGNVALQNV